MATTASLKITPINDEMERAVNDGAGDGGGDAQIIGLNDLSIPAPAEEDEQEKVKHMKFMRRQVAINRQMERIQSIFTYEYIKSSTQWLLDSATCKIALTVSEALINLRTFLCRVHACTFVHRNNPRLQCIALCSSRTSPSR